MSLKKQTISGLIWTFSQQFSVQVINFMVQIVLARILLPAEFGLIGMLTIFIAIGNSLMDSGMTSSLIRTPDADQRDYSTVFFVNIIASVIIYAILFLCAPFIAEFYNQPILEPIVRVYTLSFVIRAFVGVQTTKLTKEMNFKIQMMMQVPSVIIGGIAGIIFAYQGLGVWSLVWMNLIQSFLFTVQHWFKTGWYPSWIFDKERLKKHIGFGYKLTMSGLLNTIYNNIYNIVIGKFFTATQLGYYTRSQTLQMFPVTNLATALNKVTYPMFASIHNDDVKLKLAYKKLMQQIIFWVAPLMISLIVVAQPLFLYILTEKWLPAVPYFQLLCITGILYPIHAYNLNILNVKGRSDLFLRLEIYKKILITVGIICAVPFGIYGLIFLQIILSVAAFGINTLYSGKMINYPGKEQLKDISPLILNAFLVGAICYPFYLFILKTYHLQEPVNILVMGTLYWVFYLGMSYLFKISALFEFRTLILKR